MFPFSFGKKLEISKEYSIGEIPLFAKLTASELRFVEKKVKLVEYKKNEVVYQQGSEPDAFYVICSGRFRVFIRAPGGTDRTVTYLYRGDYFGEISILTGHPHSVTVDAINDSLVLKLDKDDFNELLKNVPSLAIHLSRSLGMRLRDESKEQVGSAKIVSVYNLREGVGQTTFASYMVRILRRELKKPILYVDMNRDGKAAEMLGFAGECRVLHLGQVDVGREADIAKYIQESSSGISFISLQNGEGQDGFEKRLTTLLSHLISRFQFVLIDLPREINELVFKVLSQSDVIYVLTDGDLEDLDKCRSLISEMRKTFTFEEDDIKLILSEAQKYDHPPIREIEKLVEHRVAAVLPQISDFQAEWREAELGLDQGSRVMVSAYFRAVRYLAREVSGRLVGLALGSGAAHGLAHVGVLKVVEEAGIPVDVVAGASMGALVGGLWAAGYTAAELERISMSLDKRSSFFNLIGISDFSIAHQGFFKGRMVIRFLRGLLGQKTFQDLVLPMKVVATNLFTAEEVVFEEGDLVEAIRASISIPGIFRPIRVNGKVLIDGGVLDPVPVKVLSRMGVKKIIAVNVLSGPSDIFKRREHLQRKNEEMERKAKQGGPIHRWFFELRRRFSSRYAANIFNVIMSTIQFMEYSIASTATAEADVVIRPVIYDASWIEFYSAEKFIHVGEEKAREQLAEIKKLVEA